MYDTLHVPYPITGEIWAEIREYVDHLFHSSIISSKGIPPKQIPKPTVMPNIWELNPRQTFHFHLAHPVFKGQ